MLALQIVNPSNMGVMGRLGEGLYSLSALIGDQRCMLNATNIICSQQNTVSKYLTSCFVILG